MEINPQKPLLPGHRGAPEVAPENSIEAFRAALVAGLYGKDHPHIPRLEEVPKLTERHEGAYLKIETKSCFPKMEGREADLAHMLKSWSRITKERTWISNLDPLSELRLQQR